MPSCELSRLLGIETGQLRLSWSTVVTVVRWQFAIQRAEICTRGCSGQSNEQLNAFTRLLFSESAELGGDVLSICIPPGLYQCQQSSGGSSLPRHAFFCFMNFSDVDIRSGLLLCHCRDHAQFPDGPHGDA
jgi:hypothetical protein